MSTRFALLGSLIGLVGACSAAHVDGGNQAIEHGTAAGMSSAIPEAGSHAGTAALPNDEPSDGGGYRVRVQADRASVCPGECATLSATVENGTAPFAFAWSDGELEGAGPIEVCPTESTTYSVTATDSWGSVEEFGGEDRSGDDSVQIAVRDDCEPGDDAAPGEVVCSHRIPWQNSAWIETSLGMHSGATLVSDAQGNIYFAGSFVHTVDLGLGPVSTLGQEDGFVMKLSPRCEPLWMKQLSGDPSTMLSADLIAFDRDGNLIVTGHLIGTVDFGVGLQTTVDAAGGLFESILVVKLDPDGNALWNHRYTSGYGATRAFDLGVSDAGDVVISGYGGTELHYDDTETSGAPEYSSLFIAAMDASGAHRFVHHVTGNAPGGSIDVMPSGDIAVSGWTQLGSSTVAGIEWNTGGGWENFLFKLDASGALKWSKPIEYMGDGEWFGFYTFALAHDADESLVLDLGSSTSDDAGNWSYAPRVLRKLDASGIEQWSLSRQYAGGGSEPFLQAELAIDSSGEIANVEDVYADATLDGESFTVQGFSDFVVRKRDASGELLWSTQLGAQHREEVWGLTTDPSGAVWVGYDGNLDTGESGEVTITKLAP